MPTAPRVGYWLHGLGVGLNPRHAKHRSIRDGRTRWSAACSSRKHLPPFRIVQQALEEVAQVGVPARDLLQLVMDLLKILVALQELQNASLVPVARLLARPVSRALGVVMVQVAIAACSTLPGRV